MVTSSRSIMLVTCACLLPGIAVQAMFFGSGVLANVLIALGFGLVTETVCLTAMGRRLHALTDGSTAVTAIIVAAALPPVAAWQIIAVAMIAGIGLGKYAYGGLGQNIFNPAMVGYAVVLVSFPQRLSVWPDVSATLTTDGLTGATALSAFKFRGSETVEDFWLLENGFGYLGGAQWEWINLAFLTGGAAMIFFRLISWRVSLGLLTGIGLLAAAGYDNGSSDSLGSPGFHYFSGATMLAVFFVATDPVTHPTSQRGQWIFGLLAGAIVFFIRAYGSYPDGIAFAVLLANAATPYLDHRWAYKPGDADV